MKKLLIATTNPGKIKEIKHTLKELPIELVTLKDLNVVADIKEDGKTFKENAVKKAKFYYKLTGLPALADDSGIEIDFLGGEPGVESRRWPGYEASDEEIIKLALNKLNAVPPKERGAQMKAAMALVLSEQDIYIFEEVIRGVILEKPLKKIIPGFPFRSLFYIPQAKSMLGESESHRLKALKKAIPIIKKYLC